MTACCLAAGLEAGASRVQFCPVHPQVSLSRPVLGAPDGTEEPPKRTVILAGWSSARSAPTRAGGPVAPVAAQPFDVHTQVSLRAVSAPSVAPGSARLSERENELAGEPAAVAEESVPGSADQAAELAPFTLDPPAVAAADGRPAETEVGVAGEESVGEASACAERTTWEGPPERVRAGSRAGAPGSTPGLASRRRRRQLGERRPSSTSRWLD